MNMMFMDESFHLMTKNKSQSSKLFNSEIGKNSENLQALYFETSIVFVYHTYLITKNFVSLTFILVCKIVHFPTPEWPILPVVYMQTNKKVKCSKVLSTKNQSQMPNTIVRGTYLNWYDIPKLHRSQS